MKTKLYFLAAICALFIFSSCEKTETFDDTRQKDNEAQFARISADPAYTKLESQSGNGHIMYKVITEGNSGATPYFTDKVRVLYTGWYKEFWTRDDTFTGDDGNIFRNKVIFFDSAENRNNRPSEFAVNGVVDGFATALQHMEVGDKWEIWIPWNLGYGAIENRNSGIKGHTTLVFEVELVEIL
ncbi:MAG: FKBP-type peptidyl-prolyl cis-trans isomerase [Bacteroidia bacterium]|nr:FKBP-type peptidyl-prolyl cis-trans isomerase [Bacteroidia bacterium]